MTCKCWVTPCGCAGWPPYNSVRPSGQIGVKSTLLSACQAMHPQNSAPDSYLQPICPESQHHPSQHSLAISPGMSPEDPYTLHGFIFFLPNPFLPESPVLTAWLWHTRQKRRRNWRFFFPRLETPYLTECTSCSPATVVDVELTSLLLLSCSLPGPVLAVFKPFTLLRK